MITALRHGEQPGGLRGRVPQRLAVSRIQRPTIEPDGVRASEPGEPAGLDVDPPGVRTVRGMSGGSEPGDEVNPSVVAAMAERGIDISDEYPKPWTDEIVRAADVVVTMGCGDACPVFPG